LRGVPLVAFILCLGGRLWRHSGRLGLPDNGGGYWRGVWRCRHVRRTFALPFVICMLHWPDVTRCYLAVNIRVNVGRTTCCYEQRLQTLLRAVLLAWAADALPARRRRCLRFTAMVTGIAAARYAACLPPARCAAR